MIAGLARSGLAAAELLLRHGAAPTLYDAKPLERLAAKDRILRLIEAGCQDGTAKAAEELMPGCDLLVLSPAVTIDSALPALARKMDIPVMGELELGSLFARGPVFALTGTNGKTTTVSLLGEMIRASGRNAAVCGNIGYPVCAAVAEPAEGDPIVIEVSSFQLESVRAFHPKIAAVTNITPDHLDRHGSMDRYIALKKRIFENQGAEDAAILNADDPLLRQMGKSLRSQTLWFSAGGPVEDGAFLRDGRVVLRLGKSERVLLRADEIRLPGRHNLQNALAAALMAAAGGVPDEAIVRALREFAGVEHRIETVRTIGGLTYINDSKGTNPESTMVAVNAMTRDTVLLAGGYDKKTGFDELARTIVSNGRIVHAVLFGQTAGKIEEALRAAGFYRISRAKDMFEAIDLAGRLEGFTSGNILLSPACASFDQFSDYEQRGRQFKEHVLALKEEGHGHKRV